MAGVMIEVIPKTSYTLSLAASASQPFVLAARAIDTQDWVSGQLVVTLHSKTFSSSTATALIRVYNTFFDPGDPSVLWQESAGTVLATATIANADVAPNLYITALGAPLGPYLNCVLNFQQGANTGSCTWTMTVRLLGRDA